MKLFVCTVLLIASSWAAPEARDKRGIYGELDGLLGPSLHSHSALYPLSSRGLHYAPLYSSPLRSIGHAYSPSILPLHSSLHSAPLLSAHDPLIHHAAPLHVAPLRSALLSHTLPLHHSPLLHSSSLSHSLPLDSYHHSLHSAPLHLSPSVLHSSSLDHASYPISHASHRPVVVKVIKAAPARYASGWW